MFSTRFNPAHLRSPQVLNPGGIVSSRQRNRGVSSTVVGFRVLCGSSRLLCSARAQFRVEMAEERKKTAQLSPELHLKVFEDGNKLCDGLAEYIVELSADAVARKMSFSIVLSGGSLVSSLKKLTESPWMEKIEWGRWHVFWVDERLVNKDDPDSSYKLAHDLLLSKVAIPAGQVYTINSSLDTKGAAEEYESVVKHCCEVGAVEKTSEGLPRFDLILLGMGPDGHVASLFPNHPLVTETSKWVAAIEDSPKPPPKRITMTFPVINSAANLAFVATGFSKAEMLKTVFGERLEDGELPAQLVFPVNGKLSWFVDRAAASYL